MYAPSSERRHARAADEPEPQLGPRQHRPEPREQKHTAFTMVAECR